MLFEQVIVEKYGESASCSNSRSPIARSIHLFLVAKNSKRKSHDTDRHLFLGERSRETIHSTKSCAHRSHRLSFRSAVAQIRSKWKSRRAHRDHFLKSVSDRVYIPPPFTIIDHTIIYNILPCLELWHPNFTPWCQVQRRTRSLAVVAASSQLALMLSTSYCQHVVECFPQQQQQLPHRSTDLSFFPFIMQHPFLCKTMENT